MRIVPALFAASLLMLASPGFAADEKTLGCVGERLSPAARDATVAWASELAAGRKFDDAPEIARTGMEAAIDECVARHGWSEPATRAAAAHAIAKLLLPPVRNRMTALGLNHDDVVEGLRALTPQQQDALAAGNEVTADALLARMRAAGHAPATGEERRLVILAAQAQATINIARAGFLEH